MEAHILRFSLIVISVMASTGATFRTANFIVTAPDEEVAKKVGKAAETFRHDLAVFWLAEPLPNWSRPCKLKVRPGSMGAGGETKFQFVGNEVLNWDMSVQGSLERIIDSVLPHEVNHTIFACHFRRPLPRWADEGAATLFEHRSEQLKQLGLLNQVIKSDREFIPLGRLLQMKEYPKGYRPMLIMYAEGYALADFLVQQGGRKRYLQLLADGARIGWTAATKKNYHHGGVDSLEKNWKSWILAGMPKLKTPGTNMLASTNAANKTLILGAARPRILDEYSSSTTVRLQSPGESSSSTTSTTSTDRNARPLRNATAATRTRITSTENVPLPRPARPAAGHSATAAVFRGLPVNHTSAAGPPVHREASLEAPRPRNLNTTSRTLPKSTSRPARGRSRPVRTSVNGKETDLMFRQATIERPGVESTALIERSSTYSERRKLPQERKLVTGSIPQWAGFPGQKELF